MFQLRYKPCRALVIFSLPKQSNISDENKTLVINEIYDYLDRAFLLMPWSLAIPLWHIQKLFQLSALLFQGRCFSRQSEAQREKFILFWCHFGRPFEALIRLYRSLVLVSYFEHPLVRGR